MSAVLVSVLSWVSAHPAEAVMLLGALASLAVKPLEKWPMAQRAAAVLAQLGVNLPGVMAALKAKAPAVVAQVAAAEVQKLESK